MTNLKALQEIGGELKEKYNTAVKAGEDVDSIKIRYPSIVDDILGAEHFGQVKNQLQDYFNDKIEVPEFAKFYGCIHSVLFMEKMEATRAVARKDGLWDDKVIQDIKRLERYKAFGN